MHPDVAVYVYNRQEPVVLSPTGSWLKLKFHTLMWGFESDVECICTFIGRMLSTIVRVRQIHGDKYAL